VRTHKHDPSSRQREIWHQTGKNVGNQPHVRTPKISLRSDPLDQSGLTEHPQMMCHQVRRHTEHASQLTRRHVTQHQAINNRQPRPIAQRRMHLCAQG
jgi:hypothetical protein